MSRTRLDLLLVDRGLAESRARAQALIMAGQVRLAGQVEIKPSAQVEPDVLIEIDLGPRYVSRGGEKLEAALEAFGVKVDGAVCADLGSSTGGFTDCLLQHGAERVYAIDVGKGQLHWKLRNDPRVVVMEGTNARHVAALPEMVSLVTIDASFISLKILLPVVRGWFSPSGGGIVALIKPQFEAGRKQVARGRGVVRDPALHQAVVEDLESFARQQGFTVHGNIQSPILGPKGNIEFLLWLEVPVPAPPV